MTNPQPPTWLYWLGAGGLAYLVYRKLTEEPAWEMNARRSKADMKILKTETLNVYEPGMNVSELAAWVGVSPATAVAWLKGEGVYISAEIYKKILREHDATTRESYPDLTDKEYNQAIIKYERKKRALLDKWYRSKGSPRTPLWRLRVETFGEPTGLKKELVEAMFEYPFWTIRDAAMGFGASEEQVQEWLWEAGFTGLPGAKRMRHPSTREEFSREQRHGRHISVGQKRSRRRNPDPEEFQRVCSWCKRMFVEGKWVPGIPETEWVTHGICEPCEEMVLREIDEMDREEELR